MSSPRDTANTRAGYDRVPGEEPINDDLNSSILRPSLPVEPPSYDLESAENDRLIENMEIEAPQGDSSGLSEPFCEKFKRFRTTLSNNVVVPVREKIMDPLASLMAIGSERIDLYLSKIGNPLILRRFFYVFLMSAIAWFVAVSGLLPSGHANGTLGTFSNHNILLEYAKQSLDLSKMERDLEYLSSMPHMSGTKGDTAIAKYIQESYRANGLKLVKDMQYRVHSNYPGNVSLTAWTRDSPDQAIDFPLDEKNFNPLGSNGELQNVNLIYAYKGSLNDLQKLKDDNILNENDKDDDDATKDFVLLMHYDKFVGEQMMAAQELGAKGVIFISEPMGDNKDIVQMRSVGIPQYGTGDALTPGWFGSAKDEINANDSKTIPHIPSLPISRAQGEKLLSLIPNNGVQFEDSEFSGHIGDTRLNMQVENAVRDHQTIRDIVGKYDGGEQTDKAIIIGASRNSINHGAMYPNTGTALLLSLLQLFQEMKYKYDWKPLRNIYFISFGGNELNYAGSTELMEQRLNAMKDEVYTYVDISQLAIWDDEKKLNIQAHPLLHDFFQNTESRQGFEVSVEHIQQYGDWIPFLANGIPVSVISAPKNKDKELPIDTTRDTFENAQAKLRDSESVGDLVLYLFHKCLKLADEPLIPFNVEQYINILGGEVNKISEKASGKLNLSKLIEDLNNWRRLGIEWRDWRGAWNKIVYEHESGVEPAPIAPSRWLWNRKICDIGRQQCLQDGLPEHNFYKNVILSPRIWTQDAPNGAWIFPAIKDAIVDGDWSRAQEQVDVVEQLLQKSMMDFLSQDNNNKGPW
ncbi:Tre1p NDAI_0K01190 [Naumovozyma dairenensis CBS 421]|uniref:Transferrin receptor-like dimerisation domain-containing protein n=1 Tax=Naumovozyma dairenensis (strain ATCC 10597 / BCRC 20456 / CBS 421 / NBRC 0211 / NRRL Y-12639) TaxID=1071378 RepID=G0WHP9_NAUDC|nr:hypothetical protein NDAI_0K01190 [Naumovozyma dairenensis CBS 421]CCD27310.1 hypothetical protein NDAI_0K01190 [Naumovozyma dairenensis CBS 421]